MRRFLFLTALALFSAGAAQAELRACNESGVSRSLAIGYSDAGVWTSEGWWVIAPGACITVRAAPLTQRYIYWRATTPGQDFTHENFMFCVSDTAFTIVGDTDCAARGHKSAGFRKADTGETGTTYTLVLPVMAADGPAAPSPMPEPAEDYDLPADAVILSGPFPPTGDAFQRGQRGEPFTQSALMQSCEYAEGMICFLYAEGFRYAAFGADAPEPAILDILAQLAPNTPVQITGDILSYGDITAEVILSQIAPGPADPKAAMRAAIQGPWVSMDDASYTAVIVGSEIIESSGGDVTRVSMFVLDSFCPDGSETDGDAIGIYEMGGDPADARCWAIDEVTADSLFLFNLPRGNLLSFRRP